MAGLADSLRALLGPDVGIGISDPRDPATGLWPGEDAAITRAISARRSSFAAGRRAARAALSDIGLPPHAIPTGTGGAPRWPAGITGSIAHCETTCIAAVARSQNHIALGIDIEPATPLEHDLIPIICTPAEQQWLQTHPSPALAAKQVFCAKEAIYKAQYPLTGQIIGFDAVTLTWDGDQFTASAIPGVSTLAGRIQHIAGFIMAASTPQVTAETRQDIPA